MQGVDYSGTILILKMDKGVPLPFEIFQGDFCRKPGAVSKPEKNRASMCFHGGDVIWATKKPFLL